MTWGVLFKVAHCGVGIHVCIGVGWGLKAWVAVGWGIKVALLWDMHSSWNAVDSRRLGDAMLWGGDP